MKSFWSGLLPEPAPSPWGTKPEQKLLLLAPSPTPLFHLCLRLSSPEYPSLQLSALPGLSQLHGRILVRKMSASHFNQITVKAQNVAK